MRAAISGAKIVAALTGEDQALEDFMPGSLEAPDEELQAAAQRTQIERLALALGAEVV